MRPSFQIGVREYSMLGKPAVYLDGEDVVRMGQNRFLTIEASPGRHIFSTHRNQIAVDVAPGQELYLRVTTRGFWPMGELSAVTNEQGGKEMYPLAPSDPKDVRERWRPSRIGGSAR